MSKVIIIGNMAIGTTIAAKMQGVIGHLDYVVVDEALVNKNIEKPTKEEIDRMIASEIVTPLSFEPTKKKKSKGQEYGKSKYF